MCVDRFHIISLFLSNPCNPSTLCKEAFVNFVCPTDIPQPPFAWKYYRLCMVTKSISLHNLIVLGLEDTLGLAYLGAPPLECGVLSVIAFIT